MSSKIALIINNPSYDRVSYALSIAAVSAAQLKEVHVLFTYGAVKRLVKDKVDYIGNETDEWIRKNMEDGLQNGSIKSISQLLAYLKGFGGKVYACVSALKFHDLSKEMLIKEVDEIIGISTFLERIQEAMTLYI